MQTKCNKEYPYYCMNPDHTHGNEYYSGTCYCWQNWANPRETLEQARRVNLDMYKKDTKQKLPTQWERVEIRSVHQWTTSTWDEAIFVCFFLNKPLVKFDDDTFDVFDEWRYPPKKTELTLAEVEERLGLEKWSLIIK